MRNRGRRRIATYITCCKLSLDILQLPRLEQTKPIAQQIVFLSLFFFSSHQSMSVSKRIHRTVTAIVENLASLREMAPDGSDQVRAYFYSTSRHTRNSVHCRLGVHASSRKEMVLARGCSQKRKEKKEGKKKKPHGIFQRNESACTHRKTIA
jgi:hypothetical protein